MTKPRKKPKPQQIQKFIPLNDEQEDYLIKIDENVIVICTGKPGSGKTAVAISAGVEYVQAKEFDQIIITKPIVETGDRGVGLLPGTLWQKIEPFFQNIIEELQKQLGKDEYYRMLRDGIIRYIPLEIMRGMTLDNALIILDESNNATTQQIKMLLTRIGKNAKLVINGDVKQSDLDKTSGLTIILDKLHGIEGVEFHHMNETVRNGIIAKVLERLE